MNINYQVDWTVDRGVAHWTSGQGCGTDYTLLLVGGMYTTEVGNYKMHVRNEIRKAGISKWNLEE